MNRAATKFILFISGTLISLNCSVKTMGANIVANALTSGGSSFMSDNDPELVKEAIPFGLKTYESLLETNPEHEGLLLALASGFTSYAYLLQVEAEQIDQKDYIKARELRIRASNLYIRGRNYSFQALALQDEKFVEKLKQNPQVALENAKKGDVPFLYWAGAAWAGAAAAAKNNTSLIAGLPYAGALVKKAAELDSGYNEGAPHEFLIAYEASRPGGDLELAKEYYSRALELSKGKRASVYIALAENVNVREQNLEGFKKQLNLALSVNIDEHPEVRLLNTIAQNRAKWLQKRIPDLFFEAE